MNTKDTENTNKNVDFTKPFQFYHTENKNQIYTCTVQPDNNEAVVSWDDKVTRYFLYEVKESINKGYWIPLTNENTEHTIHKPLYIKEDAMKKLEDYIRAIYNSVPEDFPECGICNDIPNECYCGEFIEVPEQDVLVPCKDDGYESLLDAIKSFTQNTSATVFMVDGEYEVYCLGLESPFKAATDAEMWKLIEAVEILEGLCKV